VNDSPIESPMMKVAGSPTRVSRPDELAMNTSNMIGCTKSIPMRWHSATIRGPSRITTVAFGRKAQIGVLLQLCDADLIG
jgi:hypothetical protein